MPPYALPGLLLVLSYLLGSLPFGVWIAWKAAGVDIRQQGSGNIGSTNVGRVCGRRAGALTLCLDVLKGLIPPLALAAIGASAAYQILAGVLAIAGHNWSPWLGFRGGKGIATSLGVLTGVAPRVVLPIGAVFLLELATLGYVSLGAMLAASSLPLFMWLLYPADRARLALACAACLMALYRHRANMARLARGTEPRISRPSARTGRTSSSHPSLPSPFAPLPDREGRLASSQRSQTSPAPAPSDRAPVPGPSANSGGRERGPGG